jgi:hypothetical protein
MQIDGHHTLTYIAARLAGFPHSKASIIAYSAQYVDDATNSGTLHFKNGAMYQRISSAHKMLDYRNTDELANHQVWIPFHFLPGNGGKPAGHNPDGSFIKKLICRPDSPLARDMLTACVKDHDKPYALHRLGVAMHVYADTWAHQNFAGVNHKINEVDDLKSNNKKLDGSFFKKIANFFLSQSFPLGHGAALSHPDRPSLVWSYTNGLDDPVERNNPKEFFEATDKMCRAIRCFRNKDLTMDLDSVEGLPSADVQKLLALLKSIEGDSGEIRHSQWLAAIEQGAFSFGPERLSYVPKGIGSWKFKAIGQKAAADTGRETFPFRKTFLKSNWKLFHDAIQAHRFDVIHDVLPRYGICAA